MARDNFEACFIEMRGHEGGWSNHPRDPGGATMYGVIQRNYDVYRDHKGLPRRSVRNISEQEVREIYITRYWNPVWGDELPHGLDLVAFDAGVNSGPPRGIRWLQVGVGAKVDGRMGPQTLAKSRAAPAESIEKACAARMSFLRALSHWDTFGRGWSRRVASIEAVGTRMWLTAEKALDIRHSLDDRRQDATVRASHEAGKGTAQVGGAGAGGAGSITGLEMDPTMATAFAAAVVVIAVLLALRAYRRRNYQKDRHDAYAAELEKLA